MGSSVVLQFLTNQKITDKQVHEILKTHLINGALLGPMTLDDLKRLGVPVGFTNSIVKKVSALKEFQAKCLDTNFHEMDDLAIDIMNESMKSEDSVVFPCPSWDENQFSAKQKQAFEFCMHKLDFTSKASMHNNSKSKSTICQNLTFPNRFMYEYLNPRIESSKTETRQGIDHESKMKVTLVITELSKSTQHRFVRKFGLTNGMFHSALIVGPWYLEWGDKSLATVRQRSSAKAVFGATISEIKGTERQSKT